MVPQYLPTSPELPTPLACMCLAILLVHLLHLVAIKAAWVYSGRVGRCMLFIHKVTLNIQTGTNAKAGITQSEPMGLLPDGSNCSSQSLGGAPAMGQGRRGGTPRATLHCACAGPERRAVQRLRNRHGCRGARSLPGCCKAARRCPGMHPGCIREASPAHGRGPCWERAAKAHRLAR